MTAALCADLDRVARNINQYGAGLPGRIASRDRQTARGNFRRAGRGDPVFGAPSTAPWTRRGICANLIQRTAVRHRTPKWIGLWREGVSCIHLKEI
jgi:hypothetical protein